MGQNCSWGNSVFQISQQHCHAMRVWLTARNSLLENWCLHVSAIHLRCSLPRALTCLRHCVPRPSLLHSLNYTRDNEIRHRLGNFTRHFHSVCWFNLFPYRRILIFQIQRERVTWGCVKEYAVGRGKEKNYFVKIEEAIFYR